jgi:ribonucleotide monophosphatase NagD (HAD superfamily)
MRITEFKSIVTQYKTVFFDAFGVIKNHKGIIPGIEKTFEFLDAHDINYFILTNDASRSPEALTHTYLRSGITSITPEKIISSGMLARDWLSLKIRKVR